MDLGQDWGALHRTLYPRRKRRGSSESSNVFIAHHAERSLRIVGDRDELLFSTGAPLAETLQAIGTDRRAYPVDVVELDRALNASLAAGGGIHEQLAEARGTLARSRVRLPEAREHFLIEAVRSWWGKFLPTAFGVYLSLEGTEELEPATLLLIFRKGELVGFDEPDFSGLSAERRADLAELAKVLRERYRVPVQGFAMNRAEFTTWSESADASATWKSVAKALRTDRLQLVPFRFGLAALIGARGIFGL